MHYIYWMLHYKQIYCITKFWCILKWTYCTTFHQVGAAWGETKGILNISTLISFPSLFSVTARAIYKTFVFVTQGKLRSIGRMDEKWQGFVITHQKWSRSIQNAWCAKQLPSDMLLCMPHAYLLQWNSISYYSTQLNIKLFGPFSSQHTCITRVLSVM